MRISGITLIASLALCCGLAHAQAYRWVDKDGKVRYSDVPPAGAKATPLKPPPTPPAAPPTAGNPAAKDGKDAKKGPLTPAEQEQAYKERQTKTKEAQEKETKEAALAEQRKQNCAAAQESLRSMQTGRRMAVTNEKGETVYLEDAQVQERIAQANKVVAESCK
jgi:hypothetical protein